MGLPIEQIVLDTLVGRDSAAGVVNNLGGLGSALCLVTDPGKVALLGKQVDLGKELVLPGQETRERVLGVSSFVLSNR